jgi:hypothetical protein
VAVNVTTLVARDGIGRMPRHTTNEITMEDTEDMGVRPQHKDTTMGVKEV